MTPAEPGSNTRLRAARQAKGLRSQQHLADAVTDAGAQIGLHISITDRTVRRWESENPPWPHPEHQAALEHLFGQPITELGFTPPWANDETEAPQQRPTPAVGSVSGPFAVFTRRALSDPLPGAIAADYITITSAYRHMYWTVPPVHLHDAVATHVKLTIFNYGGYRRA
jgi:hypothetical protein